MTNQSKTNNTDKNTSALEKFSLAFEYDIPWNDAKQTTHLRPIKSKK